jgi:hypothetical protein
MTKTDIFNLAGRRAEPLHCEWGDIYLLRFNGLERRAWDSFAQNMLDDAGNVRDSALMRSTAVQMGVCDKDGNLRYAPADVEKLMTLDAGPQEVIFLALCSLNKLTKYDARLSAADFFLKMAPR